jgi:hypothetical protein
MSDITQKPRGLINEIDVGYAPDTDEFNANPPLVFNDMASLSSVGALLQGRAEQLERLLSILCDSQGLDGGNNASAANVLLPMAQEMRVISEEFSSRALSLERMINSSKSLTQQTPDIG